MFVRRRRRPRATLAEAATPVHGARRPAQPAARPSAPKLISWTALALLTVGSVGNLGSASALAVVGLASVFLYVLPALVFLVPVSLVAAELAGAWPGGVYNWVSQGISAPMGLVAVWCEFAQTIFFYPALLAYVADTLAYPFDPGLAANGVYTAVVIVILFWGGVLLCSLGPTLVAKLGSRGTGIGTLIPAAILLALGVAYLVQGQHPDAPMTAGHLLPAWNGLASIVLVVNSFFTYAGVEVNAVHVNELRNPARDYPKSIFLAMALVLAVFIGPTLAISWVIPSARISFTVGVMQAFNSLFTHFGLGWAVPLIAIALAVGALAGMISWLDGPSEGLLLIGRQQGFLPPYFQKVNRYGIEVRIIATEGVVITLIAVLYAFIPNVSHAFWIFTVLATQVYLIMYVLMFIAAIRLRRMKPKRPGGYRAPALGLLCLLGTVASVAALVIGFVPPAQFSHLNPLKYTLEILGGILLIGIVPPLLMDRLRKPTWKAGSSSSLRCSFEDLSTERTVVLAVQDPTTAPWRSPAPTRGLSSTQSRTWGPQGRRVTQSKPQDRAAGGESRLPSFDPGVPNPARMWNYWLGGKDNFAADRELAGRVLEVMPSMPLIARAARLFLIDAVHQLATVHGIRQFLDIGTGLPTADNTHDVAQRAAPDSRVVYVDHDPVVLTHAQALLTSSREGATDYLQADLRDTETILKGASRTLDLSRPVAVLLIAILHFIPDADDPYAIVTRLMDAVPSGSYLVMAHGANDIAPEAAAEMARRYNEMSSAPITIRNREQVARFFDGLDLLPPGLVPISQWGLAGHIDATAGGLAGYCGIGRKP